ncbi:sulfatase family protein [Adhaeretor mobilis]|nr:sulfatase [Adhaeretor mobilis]
MIVSEDNGPELGCYGDPYVHTPFLDKLAEEGVRFQNAYVPQAGCSQSRAALLTGLYPHQNGQIGLATWKFHMYREDAPNLVRSLKAAGYHTGMIGKLHVKPESAFPFDVHKIPSSNFKRKKLGDYAKYANEFFQQGDKPFFLSVNYPDAHRPFLDSVAGLPKHPLKAEDIKPLAYMGLDSSALRAETASYYNSMSRLDALIGQLLAALQRSGKAGNTLVIYLGDHGADLLRGKRTSYEGGVRIPLIVRWPGRILTQQVREELVSTLDLMPTILAAAKAEPIANLPGRSLLPLLRDEETQWRQYLYTEFHTHSAHNYYPQRTVRNARYKLVHNLMAGRENPGYDFTANHFIPELANELDSASPIVRAAYQLMKSPPKYELYDLQSDPYEFEDLSTVAEQSPVLDELKSKLDAWRHRTNDPLLNRDNLERLKEQIDASMVDGNPQKERVELTYEDYFFSNLQSKNNSETKK